jgi:hypothetical protein
MIKTNKIPTSLIAPCGMNCQLCGAYIRDRNVCPGCRGDDRFKSKSCVNCRIKNCEVIATEGLRFCYGCDSYPCKRIKHLDKRYRMKYGMSMIENLAHIQKLGIRQFVRDEVEKWTCPGCGGLLCVHKPECPTCQRRWR